jgi:hypothetical protein
MLAGQQTEKLMNTKKKKLIIGGLGLVLSLSCTSSVVAADTAGFTSGTTEVLTTIPLKNGLTATRVHHLVGIVTDTQEGLFHGGTQQCLTTIISDASGSIVEGHGACDGIDPDGDVWWIAIDLAPNAPIRWTITAGTGKYEGLAMSGVNNATRSPSTRTALRSEDSKEITSPIDSVNRRKQFAASAAVECCSGRSLIGRPVSLIVASTSGMGQ